MRTAPRTAGGAPVTANRQARPSVITAVLCTAGVAAALMQTIIVPLIPRLPEYLRTTNDNAAWALTVTLLTAAVAMPIAGRLGDLYGKWRLLIASLAVVIAGSVLCAVSDTLAPFLFGRGLQGLGMGAVALGLGILRDVLPPERLAVAVAMMSAALGIGGALGLPLAAVIAQWNWHALFWVAAAYTAACLIAVVVLVPESVVYPGGRFDFLGAAGLTVALTLLLLPLSKGAAWGWSSGPVLTMFAASAVALAGWVLFELRRTEPLVDLRTNASRPVALTNAASAATGFAFFAITMVPVLLLMAPASSGNGNDLSMSRAGLYLTPGGLVMVGFAVVGAILSKKFGGRVALAVAGAAMAAGYLIVLIPLGAHWPIGPWQVVAMSCTVSAGIGIAYAVMPALIMAAVPRRQTGEANGVNSLVRSLGTAVAAAVVGMLLAHYSVTVEQPGEDLAYPTTVGYVLATVVSLVACLFVVVLALAIPRSPGAPLTRTGECTDGPG